MGLALKSVRRHIVTYHFMCVMVIMRVHLRFTFTRLSSVGLDGPLFKISLQRLYYVWYLQMFKV